MTLLVLIILTGIICPRAAAQDLSTTLQQMRDRYANSAGLHLVMDIQAYESEAATTPFFEQQAEVKKAGEDYRYRFQDREVLMNERVSLVVDNAHRLITCQKRDRSAEAVLTDLPFANLDSLLTTYGTATFRDETRGIARYEIAREGGDIERIEVHIDTQELLTQALTYHYRNGSRVDITFETMDLQPNFTADTFAETAYVTHRRGSGHRRKWQLAAAYQQYQLIQ